MHLLSVENISKSYSDKILFENVTFGVESGDKVGIIGVNGTGKSTLHATILAPMAGSSRRRPCMSASVCRSPATRGAGTSPRSRNGRLTSTACTTSARGPGFREPRKFVIHYVTNRFGLHRGLRHRGAGICNVLYYKPAGSGRPRIFSRRCVHRVFDSALRTAMPQAAGSPTTKTFFRPRVMAV